MIIAMINTQNKIDIEQCKLEVINVLENANSRGQFSDDTYINVMDIDIT